MSSKFAGLRAVVEAPDQPTSDSASPNDPPQEQASPVLEQVAAVRAPDEHEPWTAVSENREPVKILNGRVPRSVRIGFGRQLTDAIETMNETLTLDVAVEAMARLVIDDEEVRRKWRLKMWELRKR